MFTAVECLTKCFDRRRENVTSTIRCQIVVSSVNLKFNPSQPNQNVTTVIKDYTGGTMAARLIVS